MTDIESTKTVTTTQAAAIIGVSRATVARFCDEGRLPYAKPGKHRILRLDDVLAFKAETAHGLDAPLTDRTDATAVGRIQAYLDVWDGDSSYRDPIDRLDGRNLHGADLRTILAEHREMRERLAGLDVEWAARSSRDCAYGTKEAAEKAAAEDYLNGYIGLDTTVEWRLVGDWQPADSGQRTVTDATDKTGD